MELREVVLRAGADLFDVLDQNVVGDARQGRISKPAKSAVAGRDQAFQIGGGGLHAGRRQAL